MSPVRVDPRRVYVTDLEDARGGKCYEPRCHRVVAVILAGVRLCRHDGIRWMGKQLENAIHAYKDAEGRKS